MAVVEILRVIHISVTREVLSVQQYAGTADRVIMPFRAIAADILRLNSRALVLSHNHPSGDPAPSAADLAVTRQLTAMLGPLGVRLHDHIITGGGRVISFRDIGLL
jgi:DNA repair protein RadC